MNNANQYGCLTVIKKREFFIFSLVILVIVFGLNKIVQRSLGITPFVFSSVYRCQIDNAVIDIFDSVAVGESPNVIKILYQDIMSEMPDIGLRENFHNRIVLFTPDSTFVTGGSHPVSAVFVLMDGSISDKFLRKQDSWEPTSIEYDRYDMRSKCK